MAKRILMIEDDETLSGMVDEYLGTRGIEVTTRSEAKSGLKLLKQAGKHLQTVLPTTRHARDR